MNVILLMILLMVNAGMDREAKFDFELSTEHRGGIALYGSIVSELPPDKVGVVWKQLSGPKAFITQPNTLRPFMLVEASGEYKLMLIASDGKELVNDVVVFTVKGK